MNVIICISFPLLWIDYVGRIVLCVAKKTALTMGKSGKKIKMSTYV